MLQEVPKSNCVLLSVAMVKEGPFMPLWTLKVVWPREVIVPTTSTSSSSCWPVELVVGTWTRLTVGVMERSPGWTEASTLKSIFRTTGEFMVRVMGNGDPCTVTED